MHNSQTEKAIHSNVTQKQVLPMNSKCYIMGHSHYILLFLAL